MKPNPNSPPTPRHNPDDASTNDMSGHAANASPFNHVSPNHSDLNSPENPPSPPRMYSPEPDGMDVGGGSDEELSHQEQQRGTKRTWSEDELVGNQNETLSFTEPLTKKRRTQEPDIPESTSTTSQPPLARQNRGLQLLVNWTCEHLLHMNRGRTFHIGDTFSENTFAYFRNAIEQATCANAPELVQKLLETGMQNCMPKVLDHALNMAISVNAHDVISLLKQNSSSSSSSATTLAIVCPVEKDWQNKINPELAHDKVDKIINALLGQNNSTLAYTLLFGEDISNWPQGEFKAVTIDFFEGKITTFLNECGAVTLESNEKILVLFSSDFDQDIFQKRLLHRQHQELIAMLNHEGEQENLPESTVLMFAAQWGDLETVRMLLQNGAQPESTNRRNCNALMLASSKGHIDIVSLLLTYPVNINAMNEQGFTALSYAIEGGFLSICRLLFHYGASLDNEDNCPLHLAAKNGCTDMYRLLIEKGADIHQTTTSNSIPLGAAAEAGNLDACKLLLSLGADINHINDRGFSILNYAVNSGNPDILKYLLNAGLQVGNLDKKTPPLVVAATKQYIDIVKILLAHGAEINQANEFGQTALFHSCINNSLEITTLLVHAGANPNIADRYERTPLVYAAGCGSIEIVKLLIKHGAQLYSNKNYGNKALVAAVKGGFIDIAAHLLQLHVSIEISEPESNLIIKFLLHDRAGNAHISMLKLLLRYGASLRGTDNIGNDALMLAVMRENQQVIACLLEQGALIGQINSLNNNALDIAMNALDGAMNALDSSESKYSLTGLICANRHSTKRNTY